MCTNVPRYQEKSLIELVGSAPTDNSTNLTSALIVRINALEKENTTLKEIVNYLEKRTERFIKKYSNE
jgi:hypothetical protein